MKIFVLSPDAQGQVDPSVQARLIDFIPDRVASESEADAVLIPISLFSNYQFNNDLEHLTKPIIVMDFMEYGNGLLSDGTHLFGKTYRNLLLDVLPAPYKRFDEWIGQREPLLYFKRELRQQDASERVKPIEFTCYLEIPETQPKHIFDVRSIECLYWWGYSHISRPKLHADIFRAMTIHPIQVISHWEQWQEGRFSGRVWATIHCPHWTRRHISEILEWQLRSKVTVAMPGNGVKTFRHAETVGTLMALPNDNLAWSYPWINEENCIRLTPHFEFATLEDAIRTCDLYPMYLAGQENLRKYQSFAYVRDWILPNIERVL